MRLSRGAIRPAFQLFPGPSSGRDNKSQSDVNFRFRFEPTLAVSEDLSIYFQADISTTSCWAARPPTGVPGPLHPHLAAVDAAPRRHGRREARLGEGEHAAGRAGVRADGLPLGARRPAQRRQLPRLRLRRHLRPHRFLSARDQGASLLADVRPDREGRVHHRREGRAGPERGPRHPRRRLPPGVGNHPRRYAEEIKRKLDANQW